MTLGVTPKGVIFGFRIRIVIVGFEPKNVPFTVCIYIIKKKKKIVTILFILRDAVVKFKLRGVTFGFKLNGLTIEFKLRDVALRFKLKDVAFEFKPENVSLGAKPNGGTFEF